jgi:O-methyltransferase
MTKDLIRKILRLGGVDLKRYDKAFDTYAVLYDRYKKYTMIPREFFILNLDLCSEFRKINGDYVECGVWRGGMSAAIAEVLGKDRTVHLYDSFEGLPPAKEIDGKEAIEWQKNTVAPGYFDNCTAEEKFAINALAIARHDRYEVHRGWFDRTLPERKQHSIAILRLDGDWYDSIMTCLEHLYPDVVDGGVIILDDYYTWDGCARAVHDYLSKTKSPSRVFQWHDRVAYIVKKS